jgi:hypothetical protein
VTCADDSGNSPLTVRNKRHEQRKQIEQGKQEETANDTKRKESRQETEKR